MRVSCTWSLALPNVVQCLGSGLRPIARPDAIFNHSIRINPLFCPCLRLAVLPEEGTEKIMT